MPVLQVNENCAFIWKLIIAEQISSNFYMFRELHVPLVLINNVTFPQKTEIVSF